MNKLSKIYISGHTGLIGSALLNKLKDDKYENLIYFNQNDLDLLDKNSVDTMFRLYRPEYVFLTAARNGGIYSNNLKAGEYLYENITIQTNIIEASRKYDVKKLLFTSASSVYPKNSVQPIKEEYFLTGLLETSNNAYSIAKISGIEMCKAYRKQWGLNFISAIHCNVYGENDNFSIIDSHVLSSLMHKFYDAKLNNIPQVELWGDGTAKREFIHSDDLADALCFLMDKYNNPTQINIGVGYDVSISFLAKMLKDIMQYDGEIIWNKSYPNGTNRKLLDSSKIKNIGWEPKINLENGIKKTYKWFIDNYDNIRK